MRKSEVQAVSGRWRALTRAALIKAEGGTSAMGLVIRDLAFDVINAILRVACARDDTATCRRVCEDNLSIIVDQALELNVAIGQRIVSSYLEVLQCRQSPFDSETMDDFNGNTSVQSGKQTIGTVIGTVALGMSKAERIVKGDTSTVETQILQKPQVILEATIQELAAA